MQKVCIDFQCLSRAMLNSYFKRGLADHFMRMNIVNGTIRCIPKTMAAHHIINDLGKSYYDLIRFLSPSV